MDFCVDEKIMNYIVPPPEKLPAMEQIRGDRFTISQLRSLVTELEEIALMHNPNGGSNIPNKVIVDFFVRKLENARSLGDESGLPDEWRNFSEYDFRPWGSNLDKYMHGYVNWKVLATFICLLQSPIPTDKEAESYLNEVQIMMRHKDNFTDQDTFVNVSQHYSI